MPKIPKEDINLMVALWMVTTFLSLMAVSARGFVRIRYDSRRKPFILAADLLIFLSFLSGVWYCCGMSLIIMYGLITVGEGRDADNHIIDNGTTMKALEIGYITGNIYYFGLYCAKGAVIALLHGIIPGTRKQHRRFLFAATVFVSTSAVSIIGLNLFACMPISNNWILGPDNCYAYMQLRVLVPSSVIQLATDLVLIALPLPLLRHLHVSFRQKLGLTVIFSLGSLCVIATIMRLILTYAPETQERKSAYSLIWSGVELSTGTCVACAPAVRTFVGRKREEIVSRRRSRENRPTTTGVAELDRSPYDLISLQPQSSKNDSERGQADSRVGENSTRTTNTTEDGEKGSNIRVSYAV